MILLLIKWLFFLPCYYLLALLAWVIAPVAVLFRQPDYYLPWWLRWASTFTDTLLGDKNHQRRCKEKGMSEYHQMVTWIWRNPARVGQSYLLGFKMKQGDKAVIDGNPETGDNHGVSGYLFTKIYRECRLKCFQYYLVQQYPFKKDKCFRLIVGWKLWDDPEPSEQPKQMSFILQPWKTFKVQ